MPVVFIHGLWLLPSSWDDWVGFFEEAGYAGLTPTGPTTRRRSRRRGNPDVFAKKKLGQIADHTAEVIGKLDKKPVVMGHSTGGLLTYMIAGRGLAAASVPIDPGPFRGVLPLPLSALKIRGAGARSTRSTAAARSPSPWTVQVRLGNALDDDEAKNLYESSTSPPGVALMQMANATSTHSPRRGRQQEPRARPMLIISGEKDHTVPWAIANADRSRDRSATRAVDRDRRDSNRGHSLTIDSGWREVAQTALDFVKRFV